MKDEFPLFPFVSMISVIGGCTAIGWAIGGNLGDVYGLGVGVVFGFGLFFSLIWLGDQQALPDVSIQWRFDAAASPVRGPRRWLARLRKRKPANRQSGHA